MKQVFSTSDVAHKWANQLQSSGRNAGRNFYFESETIYSYGSHFSIARHVKNASGENAVLFTERTYSNTTSKHIHLTRQAVRHLNVIYCYNPHQTNTDNFNAWIRQCESVAAKLANARKPELYLNQLGQISDAVHKYAYFFGIAVPAKLRLLLEIKDKGQFAQYQEQKVQIEKDAEAKRQKELKISHKKAMDKWLKGESSRLYVHDGYDYLRISANRIETTQAVQIPLELGKRLYLQIKDKTLAIGQKVMDYEVREVGKLVKIGCHTFKTDYLLKFGQKAFAQ